MARDTSYSYKLLQLYAFARATTAISAKLDVSIWIDKLDKLQ